MASVQITDKLIERTTDKIDRFERAERARFDRKFLEAMPPMGHELYDKFVGAEFLSWITKAPMDFFENSETLKIASFGEYGVDLNIPMGLKRPIPPGKPVFPAGGMYAGFRSVAINIDPGHEDWQWMVEPVAMLKEKREKAYQNKWALRRFVNNLLKNWSSLGPSVRAWPALWDLLDSDDQARQGQRPKGMIGDVPAHLGDADAVRKMTALVAHMKMVGLK